MAIVVLEQPGNQGQQVTVGLPTFNFVHFSTPHGILLLAEFIVGIIIFVLGAPWYLDIISWIAWIVSHLLIWIYLFSLHERYSSNPPLQVVEFYFNGGTCLLYALSTLFCFISIHWIVGIFAAVNTVAYGASAFFLFADRNNYGIGAANGGPGLPK